MTCFRYIHRRFIAYLALAAITLPPASPAGAQEQWVASMVGQVTGTVTTPDGRQVPPQAGAPHVDVAISSTNSVVSATVTGSVGCTGGLGILVNFAATYDPATGALSGTYTDTTSAPPRAIEFTNSGGFNWQARVQGTSPSSAGAQPYDIVVDLALPDQAIFPGSSYPANTRYGDRQQVVMPVTIAIPAIPQIGYAGASETLNMTTDLEWSATLVPDATGSTLTGVVSGTSVADRTISIPISVSGAPAGLVPPVEVAISVRFGGTLRGDLASNTVEFAGNWASQSGDAGYGGDLSMSIALGSDGNLPASVPLRITGSVSPSLPAQAGSFGFTSAPAVPIDMTVSVPFVANAR